MKKGPREAKPAKPASYFLSNVSQAQHCCAISLTRSPSAWATSHKFEPFLWYACTTTTIKQKYTNVRMNAQIVTTHALRQEQKMEVQGSQHLAGTIAYLSHTPQSGHDTLQKMSSKSCRTPLPAYTSHEPHYASPRQQVASGIQSSIATFHSYEPATLCAVGSGATPSPLSCHDRGEVVLKKKFLEMM